MEMLLLSGERGDGFRFKAVVTHRCFFQLRQWCAVGQRYHLLWPVQQITCGCGRLRNDSSWWAPDEKVLRRSHNITLQFLGGDENVNKCNYFNSDGRNNRGKWSSIKAL